MWEGGGGQDEVEGGEWDNCNSIINKYIKNNNNNKTKQKTSTQMFTVALLKIAPN